MTIILGLLLIIFVATASYTLRSNFTIPSLIAQLAGFTGLAFAFLKALSNSNLRVYFWFQRVRIWWFSDSITRWWFGVGFDGDFSPTFIQELIDFFQQRDKFKFSVKIDYSNDREVQVEIDRTLTLKIGLDPASLTASGQSHLSVISKPLEVSYGHARRKIEGQIVPVILAIKAFIRPDKSSYDLNVDFPDQNPFFAVYIAHLKQEQIGDFRVLLHLDVYSQTPRPEIVEISRNNLHITATSTDSFKQLALDFILLSADTKMLSGAKLGG
jgi:hypothetical protein